MTLFEYQDFANSQPDTMFVWGPQSVLPGDPPGPTDNTFFGRLEDFIKTTTGAVAQIIASKKNPAGGVPTPAPPVAQPMAQSTKLIIAGLIAVVILALFVAK